MSEQGHPVPDVIRAAIDTWLPEMLHPFGPLLFTPQDRHLNDLAERIERALMESGALLPENWSPLTMRELEALRDEMRRLPFWQVRTTTGEDLMVLVREALLANADFPVIAALLRSEGTHHEGKG